MMDIETMRENLFKAYESWIKEVLTFNINPRIKSQPKTFKDDVFSNPYVISIPDNWQQSYTRILIVGEEGFNAEQVPEDGDKSAIYEKSATYRYKFHKFAPVCDADNAQISEDYVKEMIKKMQKFNQAYGYEVEVNVPNSPFWRRINDIREIAENNAENASKLLQALKPFSFCWTNIDKIHRIKTSKNNDCKLTETQRKALHSSEILPILEKEIEILKPTHVIFFGWYGISLKHELRNVYEILYGEKDGLKENKKKEKWYDEDGNIVPCVIQCGVTNAKNITNAENAPYYIFTYHPGWHGTKEDSIKEYNERVLEEISKTFK